MQTLSIGSSLVTSMALVATHVVLVHVLNCQYGDVGFQLLDDGTSEVIGDESIVEKPVEDWSRETLGISTGDLELVIDNGLHDSVTRRSER